MGIPTNSGFQEPPKVSISDVINFQVGAVTLQTSFAKALQDADAESVVIVNIHQPIQSNRVEISNAKIRKNTKKKSTSLNQQIRDMIQKSIRSSKHSKETRTDKNIEKEDMGMFVIDHNRGTNKQLKDGEEKIREDNARKMRKFDETMRSPSYRSSLHTDFEREHKKNLQKAETNSDKVFSSQGIFEISKKEEIHKKEEPIVAELIDNKRIESNVEDELETEEVHSESESPMTIDQKQIEPTENVSVPLSPLTTIQSSSSISPKAIMSLPPDFFELFEQLVATITIKQNISGITDCTVTINKPGSLLDKSEVLLEFFDTNPRSCNVELRGSPEAVHYFNKYHGEFVANFRESKLSLDVNIRRPTLLQDKKVVRKRRRGE